MGAFLRAPCVVGYNRVDVNPIRPHPRLFLMVSQNLRKTLSVATLLAGAVGLGALSSQLRSERSNWPAEEHYISLPDPQSARVRALGYNELVSDLRWCQMLVYYGTGLAESTDFRYLAKFIHNIIALDPKFKKLYRWAAYAVTITAESRVSSDQEDYKLSLQIADRAMLEFPEDYEFPWIAGNTYYFDMKSDDANEQRAYKERGAELLEIAMNRPNAPKDLATKAASFRSKLGQKEQAKANLMQQILTTDDPVAQATMLRSFSFYADAELAEELQAATELFTNQRNSFQPKVPADIFVLIGGPARPAAIDIDKLATPRSLFGADSTDDHIQLFLPD